MYWTLNIYLPNLFLFWSNLGFHLIKFSFDLTLNIACDSGQTEALVPHITHETSSMLVIVFAISHASSPDWSDTIAARRVYTSLGPTAVCALYPTARAEDSFGLSAPIPAANFATTATWPSAGDGFYFYYSRRVCCLPPLYNNMLCSGERSLEHLSRRWQRWLYYFFCMRAREGFSEWIEMVNLMSYG